MKAGRDAAIAELTARLEGSRKSGLRLMAKECVRYADALRPKRGRGRPPHNVWENLRDYEIAFAASTEQFRRRGQRGRKTNAVKAIAKEYGVSDNTVWNAYAKIFHSK
jgi:hypothetical protein